MLLQPMAECHIRGAYVCLGFGARMPCARMREMAPLGMGRQPQFFACARCHLILSRGVGFFGMVFRECHLLLILPM